MQPRNSIRTIVLAVCALLCCLSTTSCRSHEAPLKSITLGTFSHAIDYTPFYVAKHFNWFKSEPVLKDINIDYVEFNDRGAISSALQSKQLQAIFAAEPPIIITAAQGYPVKITAVSCTLQQEIVVRSELPIHSVIDLKHHTIAVLRGTSSHYGLIKILRSAGLNPDTDVRIVFLTPDDARAAFESGKIDAWAVWPPFTEEQEVSGRGRVLTGGDAIINSVMAVPSDLIKQHPDIANALVDVIEHSKEWIREHPDEAESVVESEMHLDPQVVQTAWGKHDWSAHLSKAVLDDMQKKADFLATEHLTRNDIVVNVSHDLVDTRYEQQ